MIKTTLLQLIDYGFPRGVGHTTAALQGVRNTQNAVYIVFDDAHGRSLGLTRNQYMTIASLPTALLGLRRPIVIDHYALSILFYQHNVQTKDFYFKTIVDLEKEIFTLKEEVECLKKQLLSKTKTKKKRSLRKSSRKP